MGPSTEPGKHRPFGCFLVDQLPTSATSSQSQKDSSLQLNQLNLGWRLAVGCWLNLDLGEKEQNLEWALHFAHSPPLLRLTSERICPGLFLSQAAIARQLLYRDLSETAFASGSRFSLIRCDTASCLWNPVDCETTPRVKPRPGIFESRVPLYLPASSLSTKPQDITWASHSAFTMAGPWERVKGFFSNGNSNRREWLHEEERARM
jgi:hypothetical protein